MKTPKNSLLEKASQQTLSEVLGYDEGRVYYLILNRDEKSLSDEFSYSKKYRVLKNLFALGAVGKVKEGDKDFFSYIPLPPSFLYKKKVDSEIVEYLEEMYLKSYENVLRTKFSQIILKDEEGLVIFLLKYFMKDEAKLNGSNPSVGRIKGVKREKVVVKSDLNGRKIGIIDKTISYEFSGLRSSKDYEYVGYLANEDEEGLARV